MEFDVTQISSVPESLLIRRVCEWMTEAFRDSINPSFGSSLGAVFHSAGLPWPQMMACQKVCCGPDGFYWWLAELIRVARSEEHTSELQSLRHLVCRLLLEKKKKRAKN